jgi:hypothetical protein
LFLLRLDGGVTWQSAGAVRKRHFLRHLYIKCIILPRQARDKHRENSKKSAVFPQVSALDCGAVGDGVTDDWEALQGAVRKTPFLSQLLY